MKIVFVFTLLLSIGFNLNAQEAPKGILNEIKMTESNEETNQNRAFNSEVMITRTENKAIETLKTLIKRKANTREEVDLLYRLAELYMRRAKSGRFFDLDQRLENRLQKLGMTQQKTKDALKQALQIYSQILNRFPNYSDLDYVLFNSALAYSQLHELEKSKKHYLQLVQQFPKSDLIPDALLEVGEIFYQQKNFQTALSKFIKIEDYIKSRAYPYGLYKSAWCYYNLKETDKAIEQLVRVVKQNPADDKIERKHNLRRESLRDLTLFVGESVPPQKLFGFFDKLATPQELGEVMVALTGLFESHSRYKEISIFTEEYIKNYPTSPQSPVLYSKLVQTLETLKKRDQVIKKLAEMADYCKSENENLECKVEFKKVSLEIAKKWWDIWLKNKSHTEFSLLTEKAFENLLSLDDVKAPDSVSRYAFAELLFQQNKFEAALEQYKQVSEHKQIENSLKHDALYGALYSCEKWLEKTEKDSLVELQKNLATRYITEFPQGEHFKPTSYKLGFIFYKQKQYEAALKYLAVLTQDTKTPQQLLEKSQDIILDIYNIKKDYVTIQKFSAQYEETSSQQARKDQFKKIKLEANYSQIQEESKKQKVEEQIKTLMKFSSENSKTSLAQQSHWQAISIAYSNKLDTLGAKLSVDYVEAYPQDNKSKDALKEAIRAFIDSAYLKEAIVTIEKLNKIDSTQLAQNQELICDLTKIENQLSLARDCYAKLLKQGSASSKPSLLKKMLSTFKDSDSKEYANLQDEILKLNIEPYATEILISQAQKLLEKGQMTAAFNMSLKINARPVTEDIRAEARLIQAKILEKEFVSQSVKTREDKLAMVLAMKTEKLDKSFTAYSSAIKMAQSEKVQIAGLQGIDRLYSHFIDSVSNMPLPESLSAADKQSLRTELAKLVKPFEDKRKTNTEKLHQLSKLSLTASAETVWSELALDKSVEPSIKFPTPESLLAYVPATLNWQNLKAPERVQQTNGRCDEKNLHVDSLNSCYFANQFSALEKQARQLTATPAYRAAGLYYLSLAAEKQEQFEKAIWLANKILDLRPQDSLALYQKTKVLYSVEGLNSSLNFFEKLVDIKKFSNEVQIISAIKAFSDREFSNAKKDFSGLSIQQNYNYGVELLHIESEIQTGQLEKAIELTKSYMSVAKSTDKINLELAMARLYESFLFDDGKALQSYQKAASISQNTDQRNWILKKIEFLKHNKNQLSSNVGGE